MIPLAITMGEPGGVGGETVVEAWRRLRNSPECAFFTIDDPSRLEALAPGLSVAPISAPDEAVDRFAEALPVLPELLLADVTPGQASPGNAPCVVRSIDRAARLTLEGKADAVVTSPVDKKAVSEGTDRPFTGHTSYLAEIADSPVDPVMMLVGASMRVVPVTVHIPLREVPERLSVEGIVHAGKLTDESLRDSFGIESPRLRVAALNPHAGEGGLLGSEEREIIEPAVRTLQETGVKASGPYPADSLFREASGSGAILCMYHDQALIPVKSAGPCVNVTLGLPFVRTSPGHGTAYDIAGKNVADPQAMIDAIHLARLMALRQP